MNQLTRDPAFIAAATASANAAAAATAASIKQQQMHRSSTCNSELNATPEIGDWNSTDEINFMEAADPQKFNERMYPQYGWIDITKDFMDACSELSLGELAQDVVFGLFEAMSAIEMMDPKMDIGMVYNKNDAPPHTFETAVEAGILKLENLENSELIGIFDSIFACVVSWLEGNFMDLVLFTCLYLHSPKSIVDKSLRSFCYAVRNLISIVKNIIVCSDVSEEEDFQLYGNTGFTSIDDFRHSLVAPALKEAEDDMVRRSKTESNPEDTMAVVHRLRFMRFFFQSIHQLDPGNGTPPDEAKIAEIHKNLNAALELIPLIRRTIDKGTQPDPESEAPNPMGFSPRVHVRNLPPTFPRRAMIRDRPSSLQFLEELVQRLKFALKIIRQRDYYSALNFFIEFSRKSGQCILSRSVLQTLFLTDRGALVFGAIPFKDFLWDSVRAFNAPPVLNPRSLLANDRKIQMYLDSFFRYCISMNTFKHFIQICGFNRARQRDKLARFIEGFGNIQVEAARLDSHLSMLTAEKSAAEAGNSSGTTVATANCGTVKHTAQFATWVLYNCFRAMMLYLMSGFELELYSVHEFLYIYWYPYELLISFIVSALTRTETNLLEQESLAEQQSKNAPGNNSKQRKAKPKKKKQLKPYRQEIVYYHAMLSMCGGFYKAMGAFTKDERIRQPMPKFDNEEIRFNRRFAPFAALTSPPQVSYTEFKKIRAHMMRPPSSEIYMYAAKHFDQARSILESIQNPEQDILDMIQVAKVNFVVMNVLAKGHQKDSKTQPDFDFSKHRHFPIIKLN